jgi:hypothetical protein
VYQKPSITRFGGFRQLTQAGCASNGDGRTFEGTETVGTNPREPLPPEFCFTGSR